ncbi:MAG: glycosyltransferase [Chloracidobacterium sp.]|nr:glycosyltransferase [Chloracidobacterium sp.]MDW8217988.1 glycosyltransferase [Acidobacteriota bacterium]
MNVLHINEFDQLGGAATAMWRLHVGLRRLGVNSQVMAAHISSGGAEVHRLPPWRRRDYQLARLGRWLRFPDVFITSTFDIAREPVFQAADVVHLHNLHHGYFNYLALPKLLRGKRAFLTLHDMWAVTGHCTYSADCGRWKTGCGRCPYPKVYPSMRFDTSALEWRLKRWSLAKTLTGVIVLSRWMEAVAKAGFLGDLPVYRIPAGLDTEVYCPYDKSDCRRMLGIADDRFVLMFAAMNVNDPRKGGDLLLAALRRLPNSHRRRLTLLVLGDTPPDGCAALDCQTTLAGRITNDHLKARVYSAADVFVSPAREEAFGLVLQEAMACGVPCISFHVGGMPDLVRHGETGLTVEPENIAGLADAIASVMDNDTERATMGRQARRLVVADYGLQSQAQRCMAAYEGRTQPDAETL